MTKKRAARTARAASPASDTRGTCLNLAHAGQIIQDAIPGGPHDIDNTLEEAGLITESQREVFRQHVRDGVLDAGCHIKIDEIPNGADTTLRDARQAVRDNAN